MFCSSSKTELRLNCLFLDVIKLALWNVHCYYKQFQPHVMTLLQKAKAPIEKDLKVSAHYFRFLVNV